MSTCGLWSASRSSGPTCLHTHRSGPVTRGASLTGLSLTISCKFHVEAIGEPADVLPGHGSTVNRTAPGTCSAGGGPQGGGKARPPVLPEENARASPCFCLYPRLRKCHSDAGDFEISSGCGFSDSKPAQGVLKSSSWPAVHTPPPGGESFWLSPESCVHLWDRCDRLVHRRECLLFAFRICGVDSPHVRGRLGKCRCRSGR